MTHSPLDGIYTRRPPEVLPDDFRVSKAGAPASFPSRDSIEIQAEAEEGPCQRCCAGAIDGLRWGFFSLVNTLGSLVASAFSTASVAHEESGELTVARFLDMSQFKARTFIDHFPRLPQEAKGYVYAHLSSKDKNLIIWKQAEGMSDENDAFMFLLSEGYIQDYDALYATLVKYLRTQE